MAKAKETGNGKAKAKESNNLPAYTNIENILKLLESYKRKKDDEDAAKQIFGMGTSAYTNTKSALKSFGFIDDNCSFSPLGKFVVYSRDNEQKEHIQRAILRFQPYEALLINLFQKKPPVETLINEITDFWGKFDQGSTPRNMDEAAKLFMTIMEYLGFGKYTIGRQGKVTRFVWSAEAEQKVKSALEPVEPEEPKQEELKPEEPKQEEPEESGVKVDKEQKVNGEQPQILESQIIGTAKCESTETLMPKVTVNTSMIPNITINVDMTSWPEEKIKKFFKYAYGQFEEEQELHVL